MRRIKLLDLMNMTNEEKLKWLNQFNDGTQALIINQIRGLRYESDMINRAGYDEVNRTVLIAAVLTTEIGIE